MKLYLGMDNQWHIAVQKIKLGINYRFQSFCDKDTGKPGWKYPNKAIFNLPKQHLKDTPLYKENICPECYKYNKENINQEIIRFKLGIK